MEALQMITVCYNYYNNKRLFEKIKEVWKDYPHLLFVDDGSKEEPLHSWDMLPGWQLYRINEDLTWNYNGARNVAMENTPSELNLLMDLDHVPNEELLRDLNNLPVKKGHLNFLFRVAHENGEYKKHTSQFLIFKEDFDRVGGYQEKTTGYGQDGKFRKKLPHHELPEKYKIIEIAEWASPPEYTKEFKRKLRDIPNPGYTYERIT